MYFSWLEFSCHNKPTNYALQAPGQLIQPPPPGLAEAVRISATQQPNYLYLYKANPVRCTLPGLFVPAMPRQCFYLAEVEFYGLFSNPLQLGPSPRDLQLGCVFDLPIASKGKLKIALRVDPSIHPRRSNYRDSRFPICLCSVLFVSPLKCTNCSAQSWSSWPLEQLAGALSNVSMVCPPYLCHCVMVLCTDYSNGSLEQEDAKNLYLIK
jgi:hypothetical protein